MSPLPRREAAKAARVCRVRESAEDGNVILEWANTGARNASPAVMTALRVASQHVAVEAGQLRSALSATADAHPLAAAVKAESMILRQTSRFVDLNTSQTRLLSTLHTRITLARQLRVLACAGVSPISALRTTPPPPG